MLAKFSVPSQFPIFVRNLLAPELVEIAGVSFAGGTIKSEMRLDADFYAARATYLRGESHKVHMLPHDFSLTYAGIHPEEPLPTQTTIKLGELGALAGAIDVEFGAEDAQHRFSAFRVRPGAFLRHAVNRAALLVMLQTESKTSVAGNSNTWLGSCVAYWLHTQSFIIAASRNRKRVLLKNTRVYFKAREIIRCS